MFKEKKREVPLKNYIIGVLIIISVILVTWYAKKTYEISMQNKLSQSVLSRVVGEIKYDETDSVLLEKSSNYFIYISYANDKKTYNLEKKIKSLISKYEIQDNFYYLNVTDEMENDNFIEKLNNKLDSNIGSANSLPVIMYYENDSLRSYLSSYNNLFTIKDFENMLIINGYMKK